MNLHDDIATFLLSWPRLMENPSLDNIFSKECSVKVFSVEDVISAAAVTIATSQTID